MVVVKCSDGTNQIPIETILGVGYRVPTIVMQLALSLGLIYTFLHGYWKYIPQFHSLATFFWFLLYNILWLGEVKDDDRSFIFPRSEKYFFQSMLIIIILSYVFISWLHTSWKLNSKLTIIRYYLKLNNEFQSLWFVNNKKILVKLVYKYFRLYLCFHILELLAMVDVIFPGILFGPWTWLINELNRLKNLSPDNDALIILLVQYLLYFINLMLIFCAFLNLIKTAAAIAIVMLPYSASFRLKQVVDSTGQLILMDKFARSITNNSELEIICLRFLLFRLRHQMFYFEKGGIRNLDTHPLPEELHADRLECPEEDNSWEIQIPNFVFSGACKVPVDLFKEYIQPQKMFMGYILVSEDLTQCYFVPLNYDLRFYPSYVVFGYIVPSRVVQKYFETSNLIHVYNSTVDFTPKYEVKFKEDSELQKKIDGEEYEDQIFEPILFKNDCLQRPVILYRDVNNPVNIASPVKIAFENCFLITRRPKLWATYEKSDKKR